MLQDTSEDHKETWLFLDRRIQDAVQIYAILSSSVDTSSPGQALNRATEATTAVFITVNKVRQFCFCSPRLRACCESRLIMSLFQARNILGLNWNR